jgi:hypothetical protein
MSILGNIDARSSVEKKRGYIVNAIKFFVLTILATAVVFAVTSVCAAEELVSNPTCESLAGQWSGTFDTGGKGKTSRGDMDMTIECIKNGKINLTMSRVTGKFETVTISGSKILASRTSRDDIIQVYKKADGSLLLKGEYTRKGGSSKQYSSSGGTYTLEKNK